MKSDNLPKRVAKLGLVALTLSVATATLGGGSAFAQTNDGATSSPGAGDPTVQVIPVPAASTPQIVVPGFPQPGTNLDGHLPSSAQSTTDTSSSNDGFDLKAGGDGAVSVKGKASGTFVGEGTFVPRTHSVRRGDTLWDIAGRYYKSSYQWPRVWAFNPQISNPHWIYPGDRVRLRGETDRGNIRFSTGGQTVAPQTVFLRNVGWVDDPDEDAWGDLVGAPDDQMLLSYGDDVYVQLDSDRKVEIGQQLTIFRPLRKLRSGDEDSDSELVSIRGTLRVDRINPDTGLVRARIIESIETIERGSLVGPVKRRFEIVAPVRNEKDVEANIIAAVYPHEFFGKEQVLFLDRGEKDGVKPGNRFFAIRRGDLWVDGLKNAGEMASLRARVEDDRPARVDDTPLDGDEDEYPDETYAEIRVIAVRDHTCMAVVTASIKEIERNAYLLARKGY